MAYRAKSQAIKGIKKMPKKAFRAVRRAGIGAITGGAAGLAALGAGAAMDPAKAMALTGTAITAGANFGNFYGDKLAKAAGTTVDGGKQAFWGKDYKNIQQAKFDKEFQRAPETIDALTKSLGSRDAAIAAIERGDVQAFLNEGHTDAGKIGRALKKKDDYLQRAREKGQNMTEQQALQKSIAMLSWSRNIHPGVYQTNSREQLAWKNNMQKQLEASGMEKSAATEKVEQVLDDLQGLNM